MDHTVKILMLPWLAHGHLSPFLELAKRLINRNFQVYLCSSSINLKFLKESLSHEDQVSKIALLEIPLSYYEQLPPEFHTTKNLPPHLMPTLKTAFDESKQAFRDIIKSQRPDLVIYDFLQPWVPEMTFQENIKAILFLSTGAATIAYMVHFASNPDVEFPFAAFNYSKHEQHKLLNFLSNVSNGIKDKDRLLECIEKSSSLVMIKTTRDIEGKYVDYLSKLVSKEIVPVGPLIQEPIVKTYASMIIDWLDEKSPSSVVFVSFGTEYFLSREEIEEVAHGLEQSGVHFIWVVRFHGGTKVSLDDALPKGFAKKNTERGIVVEGWAPQTKILKHASVGGFVSHCGWSSTIEAMNLGVPIIAMPMQLDQPFNARLLMELGVGMEVSKENEKFSRQEIATVIKKVILQEEGEELRKNARELSKKMKKQVDGEIDLVVKKLVQFVKES